MSIYREFDVGTFDVGTRLDCLIDCLLLFCLVAGMYQVELIDDCLYSWHIKLFK